MEEKKRGNNNNYNNSNNNKILRPIKRQKTLKCSYMKVKKIK